MQFSGHLLSHHELQYIFIINFKLFYSSTRNLVEAVNFINEAIKAKFKLFVYVEINLKF